MLITPIIFCVSGVLTGILNARHHFVAVRDPALDRGVLVLPPVQRAAAALLTTMISLLRHREVAVCFRAKPRAAGVTVLVNADTVARLL